MASEAEAIIEQTRVLWGYYDGSGHNSVSNAAAPGVLIRPHVAGQLFTVTDIIAYNAAGAAAVIVFYDQDANEMLTISVGAGETAVLELKSGIPYDDNDVYARTDQAVNAEITVTGKWRRIGQ